ncbi:MAG: hypothetical protein R6T83_11715 [Salinibacter sp.]
MQITLGSSPWLLAGALVVAAGLSYYTYRRTVPALAPKWRLLLGSLRFLSLSLVVFLLLKPVLQQVSETTQPPRLAVLIDNSKSLPVVTSDADSAAPESARSALESILPAVSSLPNDGTPQRFFFDRDLRSLPSASLDSLAFDGTRTNIAAALEQVPAEMSEENLKGVVLLSDGQYNVGASPLRVAERYPVPIHTVTVGDTSRQQDLRVRRLETNDVGYTDSEVPVRATLQAEQIDAQSVQVALRAGDSLVAETDVRLPGGTAEVPVDLSFRPQQAGLTPLTVEVSSVPGEATTRNNERTTSLRVRDRKRQVLVLGGAPSPSLTAVRRVLEQEADTRLTARIAREDGSYYGGSLPDTLSRYDAIVTVGFPSAPAPSEDVNRVGETLRDGTPGLFFLDRQADLGAWEDAFAPVLPARPSRSQLRTTSRSVRLAEDAATHSIFQFDAAPDLLEDLPPLQVPTTAWAPTSDAEVLATASSDGEDLPVLALRSRAGHRTALFLGTGTHRWATLPPSLSAADSLWPGIVSNMLRWTTTDPDEQQVQVRPVSPQFEGDAPVRFTGRVYDESRSPIDTAAVEVTVTDSTGTESTHVMEPGGNGRYDLDIGSLPEGTYDYRAVGRRAGSVVGRDQGTFSVGALQIEYQAPRADPVLMRQIARRSGGRTYDSSSLSSFADDLADSAAFDDEVVTRSTEADLWRQWPLLAFLLVLLATEWTLRKRLGLR